MIGWPPKGGSISPTTLALLGGFVLVALAARQIAFGARRLRLPLITGFLVTGMLAGPHVLGLVSADAVGQLRFIDEIALGFIALAAGAEFHLPAMRRRWRNIAGIASGLVVVTFLLGSLGFYLLSAFIPALAALPPVARIAVAMLAGSVLIARSPSSAIAIVNELRAKGPFTRTVLGVTIVMDVVVIIWFSGTSAFADAVIADVGIGVGFALLLLGELLAATLVGALLAGASHLILSLRCGWRLKAPLILLASYAIFPLSSAVRIWTHVHAPFEILLEPLFICMVAGFTLTNWTRHRNELGRILQEAGPPVYVAFFTLAGASLALDQLLRLWPIALALFGIRLVAIAIGSTLGGILTRAPARHTRLSWMTFVTQAGVGLGLAKEVARAFPAWGEPFAALLIAVIVINQLIGPPMLKWAIHRIGEAHERAAGGLTAGGEQHALIFGLESQSLALARQLAAHNWQARIISRRARQRADSELAAADVEIEPIDDLGLESLRRIGADRAKVIVTLLSDDENYEIATHAYEDFGTDTLIVRLDNREHLQRFQKMGALVVDPSNAIVSLLDHLVRSPTAASLLLGFDGEQDVIDVVVRNPGLEGIALRDLDLPLDTLIVAVHRGDQTLSSHGFTRLQRGDRLTVIGRPQSLHTVERRCCA